MPGRQYDEDAFALLEKSFNDSSFMKAYQSLPVKKEEDHGKPPRPAMVNSWTNSTTSTTNESDDDDDDDGSDSGMHEGYGNKATNSIALTRKPATLPPTPPAQSRDQSRDTAHMVPLPQSQNSGVVTPVHQQGPPTPDLTPPNTREKGLRPPRPALPLFPSSSAAESFVTAREDPSLTSAQTSQLSLPLAETPAGRNWLEATRDMRLGAMGFGMPDRDMEWQEDGNRDTTPTRESNHASLQEQESFATLKQQQGFVTLEARESYAFLHALEGEMTPKSSLQSVSSDTDNTNFLRNVTVRRKRPKSDLNEHDESLQNGEPLREEEALPVDEPRETARDFSNGSAHPLDHDDLLAEHEELEWPIAVNDMLYKAIRDEKAKRLSGISQTSTTVEAVVIAGPQQRKRLLRRAGKNLALRDDLSSARTSLDSVSVFDPSRSLRRKKAQLPTRNDMLKEESRGELRAVSNPERNRGDRIQVIVIPERRTSLGVSSAHEKTHLLTRRQHQLHHSRPNASHLRREFDRLSDHFQHESPLTYDDEHEASPSRQVNNSTPDQLSRDLPVRLRHASAPLPANRPPPQAQDTFQRANGTPPKFNLSPKLEGWNRHSSHDLDLLSPTSEQAPPSPSLDLDYHSAQATMENTPAKRGITSNIHGLFEYVPASPRRSVDQPSSNSNNLFEHMPTSPRRSIDQSHANARYLHASQTPGALSQVSDRTDTIDINEAQAVSLFPHGNQSLLLIQHGSSQPKSRDRGLTLDTAHHTPPAIDEVSTPTDSDNTPTPKGSLRPIFAAVVDEPSTPPAQTRRGHDQEEEEGPWTVDSPLRNPRTAPMPPVFVIPPTPMPEHTERQLAAPRTQTPRPAAPERRQSLVQKARRYSESIIQPFFPIKRDASVRRASETADRPTSEIDRDRTLHPFWRPRGFWDDFSDSDSELEYESNYHNPFDERLPAGGDTSDVGSLEERRNAGLRKMTWPRKMSVRMPGFRGQGGFLVGNSLGIDRHGTNSRRPYVFMPKTFSRGEKDEEGRDIDGEVAVTMRASGGSGALRHKRAYSSPTFSLPFFTNVSSSRIQKQSQAPALRKKRSQDLLNSVTYSTESLRQRALRQRPSQRSLKRRSGGKWGFKTFKTQVLSLGELKERMEAKKLEREEKRREARRQEMKRRISAPKAIEGQGF